MNILIHSHSDFPKSYKNSSWPVHDLPIFLLLLSSLASCFYRKHSLILPFGLRDLFFYQTVSSSREPGDQKMDESLPTTGRKQTNKRTEIKQVMFILVSEALM